MIMVKWNIPHDVPDAMVHAVKAALAVEKDDNKGGAPLERSRCTNGRDWDR